MTHGPDPHVRANPELAPPRWQFDPEYRGRLYDRIRGMKRAGYRHLDIARRVGVSDRTVRRVVQYSSNTNEPRCGAPRLAPRHHERRDQPCTVRVSKPGDRCRFHR